MAGYVIGAAQNVNDPAGFAEYQQLAVSTLQQYGGKIVVGSNKIEVADGTWCPSGMVVIEFESLERAKQWYNSPEYSSVKPRRFQTADTGIIFVDGA